MFLPTDLTVLIFSYLPLKSLQILEEQGLPILTNIGFLTKLLVNKYKLTDIDLTSTNLLTTFDQFSKYVTLSGDIGYNGQFYLPVLICLAYVIRNRDDKLLNYYLLRFVNNEKWLLTELAFGKFKQYIPILFALAIEYNTNIANTIYAFNKNITIYNIKVGIGNLRSTLSSMQPDYLEQYSDKKFKVDFESILDNIKYNNNLITKNYINNARHMKDKVLKLFAPSDDRDRYLDILTILLGDDIDLKPYISYVQAPGVPARLRLLTTYIEPIIVILATAVLNGKVMQKLPLGSHALTYAENKAIVSEIVYDPDQIGSIGHLNFYIPSFISIFLANKANELNVGLPVVEINDIIKSNRYQAGSKAAFDRGAYILDPETAVKLENDNTSSYLYPITQFDYDLMVQFGLKPPHKQLE